MASGWSWRHGRLEGYGSGGATGAGRVRTDVSVRRCHRGYARAWIGWRFAGRISYAKALAFALDKPLIAVNHLEGHIHAVLLEHIWTQPILETPPKRFDLMMDVNVRAAYVACYYALPHMVKQQWGHVLNMCPRLHVEPSPGKVAYMISKLGMARLAIGLAAEHQRDNIAGNSLWPRTIIETQASINWRMADRSQWRTPEILCDASLALFAQEPRTATGRQWIDEELLAELAGITNFDHYWCEGRPPAHPLYIDKW